jgi:general secretion pathway protein C
VLDTYFKQYFWTFHLAVLFVAGVLSARAVNGVVAGALRPPPSKLLEGVAGKPLETAAQKALAPTQRFLERNLFGAEREDLTPPPVVADTTTPAKADNVSLDNCPDKSQLRFKLVGTVVSSVDPASSVAIFTDPSNGQTLALYPGERVDTATIREVKWRRVKVENLGHCEFFSLEDDASPTVASAAPPPPAEATGNSDEPKIALGNNVKKLKEDTYEIPREEIDNVLSNMSAVATQARIVPSFQNGKANGFKLFSIRPDSLYSKIGIQNGDIVQRINGYEMNSPDKALEIYSKLKDSQAITVDIVRRGKAQTMTYQIR